MSSCVDSNALLLTGTGRRRGCNIPDHTLYTRIHL